MLFISISHFNHIFFIFFTLSTLCTIVYIIFLEPSEYHDNYIWDNENDLNPFSHKKCNPVVLAVCLWRLLLLPIRMHAPKIHINKQIKQKTQKESILKRINIFFFQKELIFDYVVRKNWLLDPINWIMLTATFYTIYFCY